MPARFHKTLPLLVLGILTFARLSYAQDIGSLPLPSSDSVDRLRPLSTLALEQDSRAEPLFHLMLLDLPMASPQRPTDPAVVETIVQAATGWTGLVQLTLINGQQQRGKVYYDSQESFLFQPRSSRTKRSIRFSEVASVARIKPNAGEALVLGLEVTGIVVLAVIAIPFGLLMGLNCGFQCS